MRLKEIKIWQAVTKQSPIPKEEQSEQIPVATPVKEQNNDKATPKNEP